MSKLFLQIVNGLFGLATAFLGLTQVVFGQRSPVYMNMDLPDLPLLDNNLRFFGGMGLGLGMILLWITPAIDKHKILFRAVWISAFLGGIGRLISIMVAGAPSRMMVIFTFIELIVAPLLIYWQQRIAIK